MDPIKLASIRYIILQHSVLRNNVNMDLIGEISLPVQVNELDGPSLHGMLVTFPCKFSVPIDLWNIRSGITSKIYFCICTMHEEIYMYIGKVTCKFKRDGK